ncbi:uncharacterized protein LOC134290272 [Aedes albopictus]|uniref:Protein kinase domain-containing protein n=1 Tax=Aedes albopictus TaxID=7160 RepID=A0ABM1XM13_AEDAL
MNGDGSFRKICDICNVHNTTEHVINPDGKFRVVLPKKEYALKQLGECKAIATKRFMGLERHLNANPEMEALYTEFIHEYLLMRVHARILKPDSTTTKLRVVFDAACATDTEVSLNGTLMVGSVQAIVADVEKMYHMINVVQEDQPLQKILWRESVDMQLRAYQLTSVTYGTSAWHSNQSAILKSILRHLRDERELLDIDVTAKLKTLGLT